jgi:hypothetical protein
MSESAQEQPALGGAEGLAAQKENGRKWCQFIFPRWDWEK